MRLDDDRSEFSRDGFKRIPREKSDAFWVAINKRLTLGWSDSAAASLMLGTLCEVDEQGFDAVAWLDETDAIADRAREFLKEALNA